MRGKVPFRAVLRSEASKLRSLRATWWCSAGYLVLVGGGGWLAAAPAGTAQAAVTAASTGFGVGQFVLVVLGALAVTSDLGSGMSVASLTAVPRRTRLLVAKTVVVGAWCALLALVLVTVCLARMSTSVADGVAVLEPALLRTLGLQVGAAVLTGVLAVGLGAVLRSGARAVAAGLVLVALPAALALAGGTWPERVSQALPAVAADGAALLSSSTTWQVGISVMAAWAVGAWVVGAVVLERREA